MHRSSQLGARMSSAGGPARRPSLGARPDEAPAALVKASYRRFLCTQILASNLVRRRSRTCALAPASRRAD